MEFVTYHATTCGLIYGKLIGQDLAGFPLPLNYLNVFCVTRGSAVIHIDFKEYSLVMGSLIVVSDDNIVRFGTVSMDFALDCSLIQRDLASEIAYILPNDLFSYLHYNPVLYLGKEDVEIYLQGQKLLDYYLDNQGSYSRSIYSNHFQNLFLAIAMRVDFDSKKIEKQYSRQEELCWRFWDLISRQASVHRAVAYYAEQLCVTPYYLSQITKQFLSYSPKELINRQVILEIKHLLTTTDLSISEIATSLNFPDPSYMGRFFKRETGINPLVYRGR
ncbi:AraC family transcriptional regulator [Myroides pelagicus]|uniref:Helix-turn-helix domain-containing protein n=1 Tax=Myroides pelagicus TaxID=270914 RepID=A0A7K1GML0_9FLAO|nr:helix-turn-helix domain-containing protein [Myroides pelagicus]MTH30142.1 helix-turn-helix domain-containing protein [Myroides pelagicus]